METTDDTFVFTADVQDVVGIDLEQDAQVSAAVDTIADGSPDEPVVTSPLDDVVELMPEEPTDGQTEPEHELGQLADGIYLNDNGQGMEAALAALQELQAEGVDFTAEGAGTWHYNVGAFSFVPG